MSADKFIDYREDEDAEPIEYIEDLENHNEY